MGENATNTSGQQAGTQTSLTSTTGTQTRDPYPLAMEYIGDFADRAMVGQGALSTGAAQLGGIPAANYMYAADQGRIPGGITDEMRPALNQLGQISSGANSITTGDLYSQLFNRGGELYNTAQPLASNTSGALTSTQQAILDQNAERLGNRLASQYSGSGRYGSFGAGIGMARGIAETNNPLMAQYNQQNIGNALSAMGVQGNAIGLQQGAASGLSNVQQQNIGNQMNAANSQLGTYQRGVEQQQRWNAMTPELYNLAMAPYQAQWQDTQNYANALSAAAPYIANLGTITNAGDTAFQGSQQSKTEGETSQDTPWTTYAGLGIAGIGTGASLLSDRRLKTDIKKVGKDPHTSLNMYSWRYKGFPKSSPKMVGPMAQEVQKKYPEAVEELPGGILLIKKAA